jgi:uncharacterized protein YndB with AHSA1/START domain
MDHSNRSETADREIVHSRLLNAPREMVFAAWTDPKQVVQWWGPRGFTTTNQEMAVTAGGVWRFVMHGPDGRDYKNKIVFTEVVRPERLVYRHAGEEDAGGQDAADHAPAVRHGTGARRGRDQIRRDRRRPADARTSGRACRNELNGTAGACRSAVPAIEEMS